VLYTLLIVVLLYAAAVAWTTLYVRRATVSIDEQVPVGEQAASIRLVRRAVDAITKEAEPDRFFKRDAHSKPHGCVAAHLSVLPDLSSKYRYGIFAEPRKYDAWLRFSNGTQSDDNQRDARGLGLKVMQVEGKRLIAGEYIDPTSTGAYGPANADGISCGSQDFNMINYPAFFLRDVMEYEEFFPLQVENNPIGYFFHWNPFEWKLPEFRNAASNLFAKTANPLDASYYTMTAFRLGPNNAKYSVQPCEVRDAEIPADAGPNYLREAMAETLAESEACFEFKVQLQDPTHYMPIEDPTVLWDEDVSKYEPVARIIVPQQQFDTDAQNQFCEQLSISPWRGIEQHRPVGGLNRVRKLVYEAVSARRHARNQVARHEPRGLCLQLDGEPCSQGSRNRRSKVADEQQIHSAPDRCPGGRVRACCAPT
jgi:hypothetical protein